MEGRTSLVEALTTQVRVGSLVWKVLVGVATGVGIVWTGALAYAAKSAAYATDEETDAKDAAVAKAAAAALAPVAADVRELKEVRAAQAKEREREQLAKAAERKRWIAVFKHLVSLQAADREPNELRRSQAAAHARTEFTKQINAGAEPDDAAEFALDQPPPWRIK